MSFRLDIGDNDYVEVTGQPVSTEDGRVLGDSKVDKIMEHFPSLVANRLKRMVPEDFTILQLELEFEISGKIAGTGVSGRGNVVFGPKGD